MTSRGKLRPDRCRSMCDEDEGSGDESDENPGVCTMVTVCKERFKMGHPSVNNCGSFALVSLCNTDLYCEMKILDAGYIWGE